MVENIKYILFGWRGEQAVVYQYDSGLSLGDLYIDSL